MAEVLSRPSRAYRWAGLSQNRDRIRRLHHQVRDLGPSHLDLTTKQLRKAAKAYKRPLAVLLLPDPSGEGSGPERACAPLRPVASPGRIAKQANDCSPDAKVVVAGGV